MFPLARHIDGVGPEGSFVNEGRALLCQLDRSLRELCIEAIGHRLSRTWRPKHHVRSNHAAVRQRDVFAVLELSVHRSSRNSEFLCFLQIEHSWPVFLLKPPTETEDSVIERKGLDVELRLIEHATAVSARKFLHRKIEFEFQIRSAKCRSQKVAQTFGTENIQRSFVAIEMKRTEQARDSIKMISVKVSNEDRMDAAPLHRRTH